MTTEAQRIAIAEHLGWVESCAPITMNGATFFPPCWVHHASERLSTSAPDYTSDLNLMHEAEKVLTKDQRHRYTPEVAGIINPDTVTRFDVMHATAAQRAEAFLRTLNLWDDAK